jgi:tetratricopeptide (TPR) repeat protein
VVETFSVPPQFAQAGISGEVIADDLTGKINTIRDVSQSNSLSSSRDVSKDSAEDIKVEIPETGMSLGQVSRYLRLWLGHERHLSGNLRMTGEGKIALTVALDGERVATVTGASGDLDRLEQQAAERVFADDDAINYVVYLRGLGRDAEALAAAERGTQLAAGPADLAISYSLWSAITRGVTGDMRLALSRARISMDIDPTMMASRRELMWIFVMMGHDEDALRQAVALQGFREQDQPKLLKGHGFAELAAEGAFQRQVALGAFSQAALGSDCLVCSQTLQYLRQAELAARAHDGAGSRALAMRALPSGPLEHVDRRSVLGTDMARVRYYSAVMRNDWRAAVASARDYVASIKRDPAIGPGLKAARLQILAAPLLAHAMARVGDTVGAQAVIDTTPSDCNACIRARAQIAEASRQPRRADYWFARAIRQAPSIPFAYLEWGQALMARGDVNAAIAKFALASQKGPHFADALELWGEALMAKKQSHLALAMFAEAEKYAPNWGRLHLKWGQALVYAGRMEEAKAKFARAATLDLTRAENSELQRISHS